MTLVIFCLLPVALTATNLSPGNTRCLRMKIEQPTSPIDSKILYNL